MGKVLFNEAAVCAEQLREVHVGIVYEQAQAFADQMFGKFSISGRMDRVFQQTPRVRSILHLRGKQAGVNLWDSRHTGELRIAHIA